MESILEHCKDYIQRDVELQALRVTGDSVSESCHVEIVLCKDTWEEQARAIDHMVEIRQMFIDDVALSYEFIRAEDWQASDTTPARAEVVYAA
jgi:hypothetical protein